MKRDDFSIATSVGRDVLHQARLEEKRLRNAITLVVGLSLVVTVLLGVDYTAARIMFTYLDPTLGDVSLGPEFLALTVPIAVVAIHLRIADEGGHTLEYRLRRLAGVGVFVFLFGMAMMIALVYMDASDGVGSQGNDAAIQGVVGNDNLSARDTGETSWAFAAFRALFSALSPIIFFVGMTLILFVTAYACHQLMKTIGKHYDFFAGASRRSRELKHGLAEVEELGIQIRKDEAAIVRARKRLPSDPEYRFSQITSAAIADALHGMKRALRTFGETDIVKSGIFTHNGHIPEHIETREDGAEIIAEIRQATTPYAILKNLGGYPPREEDE